MMPSSRVQISHPAWCTAAHDGHAERTDPRHACTPEPMVLTRDDFLIGVTLERDDEITADGEQRIYPAGVVLGLTALGHDDGRGNPVRLSPFFAPDEARRLAAILLRLANQAELVPAEVVW